MDHAEAVQHNAAERYTIGDLPVAEVEEFERHFFECPQCSEELRALSILVSNTRAVLGERPVEVSPAKEQPPAPGRVRAWWRQPWAVTPAFAGVVVAIFAGYQALVVVPGLKHELTQIGQVEEFPLFAAARAGGETAVTPRATDSLYVVYFDKTWEGEAHKAVLREQGDRSELRAFDVSEQGRGNLMVRIPINALTPGSYVLSIQGKDSSGRDTELANYPFTLRFE
jgi:hypothetical protein